MSHTTPEHDGVGNTKKKRNEKGMSVSCNASDKLSEKRERLSGAFCVHTDIQ